MEPPLNEHASEAGASREGSAVGAGAAAAASNPGKKGKKGRKGPPAAAVAQAAANQIAVEAEMVEGKAGGVRSAAAASAMSVDILRQAILDLKALGPPPRPHADALRSDGPLGNTLRGDHAGDMAETDKKGGLPSGKMRGGPGDVTDMADVTEMAVGTNKAEVKGACWDPLFLPSLTARHFHCAWRLLWRCVLGAEVRVGGGRELDD